MSARAFGYAECFLARNAASAMFIAIVELMGSAQTWVYGHR